jgi:hypothetical protein
MSTEETPRWDVPAPLGGAAAIDSMGTIAAPFLAGIGIALAVLVISSESDFPWVAPALLALVLATAAFIACLECAFIARGHALTPGDFQEWAPALDGPEWMKAEQRHAIRRWRQWAMRARLAYNIGIVAFGVGVTCVLVPKGGLRHATDARLAVFALAGAACVAEIIAIVTTARRGHRGIGEAKDLAKRAA